MALASSERKGSGLPGILSWLHYLEANYIFVLIAIFTAIHGEFGGADGPLFKHDLFRAERHPINWEDMSGPNMISSSGKSQEV